MASNTHLNISKSLSGLSERFSLELFRIIPTGQKSGAKFLRSENGFEVRVSLVPREGKECFYKSCIVCTCTLYSVHSGVAPFYCSHNGVPAFYCSHSGVPAFYCRYTQRRCSALLNTQWCFAFYCIHSGVPAFYCIHITHYSVVAFYCMWQIFSVHTYTSAWIQPFYDQLTIKGLYLVFKLYID